MIYINTEKNFRVFFGCRQHAILEADNGCGYDCICSKTSCHAGDDIKDLARFLWKAKASYLDSDNNIRVMWLSYDAAKVALFNGHRLIDPNGNLYEFNDEFDVEINGETTVAQLPYGNYMIDFERTVEMIENGDLIDEEDDEEDEEDQVATPSPVTVSETPQKKNSFLKKVGIFLLGAAVGGGTVYGITKMNKNSY